MRKIVPIATAGILVAGTSLSVIAPFSSASNASLAAGTEDKTPVASKIEEKPLPKDASILQGQMEIPSASEQLKGTLKDKEVTKEKESENEVPPEERVKEKEIVSHILVEGNVKVPSADILKLVTHTKETKPYIKDDVKKDLADILKSGLVQKARARALQNNGEIYVVFDVEEMSEIKSISVTGNTLIPTEEITKILVSKPGEQFNKESVETDIDAIKEAYRDKGYVALVKEVNNTDGNVTYRIEEAKIEDVVYKGNTKTKSWVLDKITSKALHKGDFLTTKALQKVYEDLAATGFFKEIKVNAVNGVSKDGVILEIAVDENKTGEWNLGGGYSSTYKMQAVGGIRDKNLRGEGKSISLDFGIGSKRNNFSLSYVDPYWRKSDTKVYGEIFNSNKDFKDDSSEKHLGFELGFVKPVTKNKDTSLYMNMRMDRISEEYGDNGSKPKGTKEDFKENSITVGVLHDKRNEDGMGTVADASVKTTLPILGNDSMYTKFMAEIKNYARISARDVLASRLNLNYSPNNLPDYAKFDVGGIDSVRGLDEREQRGNKAVSASVELRHDISNTVQGVVFVDAGRAWQEGVNHSLKVAAGLGVRIKTALGILRLDAAKANGNNGWKYLFGIGQSF